MRTVGVAGVRVTTVDSVTGFPEMLSGRVKTLHPAVHGGILARRDLPDHMDALQQQDIAPIDIVVVNLYPFRATVTSDPPPESDQGVESIDIGGPAMIRAAAKNHAHVIVIVDPRDYAELLGALDAGGGGPTPEWRKKCAWKAFQVQSCRSSFQHSPACARNLDFQALHTIVARAAVSYQDGI